MTSDVVVAEGPRVGEQSSLPPYKSSWLDAIVSWIERLPGPTWAAYIALTAFAFAFVALEAALSSRGLYGQEPAYFAYAFFHVGVLAGYHFLSRGALSAWDAFRPAVDMDDATAARFRLELSTTPARAAVVLYLVGAANFLAILVVLPEGFDLVGHQPAFVALRVLSEPFWVAPLSWMIVYLLFRQTRIVSRLHRSVARVDLLKPGPLHAMSTLTARSAIVLLVVQLGVGFVPLANLSEAARLTLFLIVGPFMILSIAAFFVPLRGMHALLEAEKARRQNAVSDRIDATVATLHEVVDEETSRAPDAESSRVIQLRVDALNKTLASLLQVREFTAKLSTWPWDTSTLRTVVSALALPIVLFILTTAIDRFLL